jgi:immune inhibitor A
VVARCSVLVSCVLGLLLAAVEPVSAAVPTRGELRLLVVRAAFPDRPLAEPAEHFAGAPESLVDRLVAYYAEVSTGRLRIVAHLGEAVVTLQHPRARYVQRSPTMAREAIQAFGQAATSDADRAALARAHSVIVFFPGPGRESLMKAGDSGDPWSNYVDLFPPLGHVGAAVLVASSQREGLGSFGVLCHEVGHLLGLPELYAPGAAIHEGIGKWGLMGQGTWVGRGNAPPHLEAWSKLRLGWVDAVTIDAPALGVRVPAVTDEPLVVKVPAVPGRPQEYYLLENRQRVGFDAALPADGILVWHVDERVRGFRDAQSDPRHKLLHLVEADGRNDLDRGTQAGGNRGEAGDAWAGPPHRRRLAGSLLALLGAGFVALAVYRLARARGVLLVLVTAAFGAGLLALGSRLGRVPACGPSTPGMAPYDGEPARVVLRNFSPSGPVMSVDVLMPPPSP